MIPRIVAEIAFNESRHSGHLLPNANWPRASDRTNKQLSFAAKEKRYLQKSEYLCVIYEAVDDPLSVGHASLSISTGE